MSVDVAALETHRTAITGHCYRMLGSVMDADDAVQETMVRAWRGLERFDGRASLRTWLYRIATNVCLDALASRSRRARPMEDGPAGSIDDSLGPKERTHWLEPIPDPSVLPSDADPGELAILRESIRLAFVSALQHLPAKQRAVLLLSDVLGWSAAEVAEGLDTTVASVNSALQRARATMSTRNVRTPEPIADPPRLQLLDRYVDAFQRYDVDALVSLVREDATFSMPPLSLWLQGRESIKGWLHGRGSVCRGSRLVPVAACGSPAFAQYHLHPEGGFRPWAIIVLEIANGEIVEWNSFLDTETLFPRFGLPMSLDDR
jgi:RNA polymerase sigma-70 factor (ECF subfamily)